VWPADQEAAPKVLMYAPALQFANITSQQWRAVIINLVTVRADPDETYMHAVVVPSAQRVRWASHILQFERCTGGLSVHSCVSVHPCGARPGMLVAA